MGVAVAVGVQGDHEDHQEQQRRRDGDALGDGAQRTGRPVRQLDAGTPRRLLRTHVG
ncbi:hypothetical protein ACFQU9_26160 [Actinomadura namibiensis]|uniref:hypothetical protein n=1 Tax=Actinomadura kijaniata TaxID=46161 RepID=UPI003618587F